MNTKTTLFDGPEKKLDVFLFPPCQDLLAYPDGPWHRVVKASGSRIVSKISTPYLSAFILSESSLFLWQNRILMMTCGQTPLTHALPEILSIVGKKNVARVFYERKTALFSVGDHPAFEDDTDDIKVFFPGQSNRCGPADNDHLNLFVSSHAKETAEKETTLQLLMHDIDPSLIQVFSATNIATGAHAARCLGFDTLYPRLLTDSYLFSPCGFSMNGILDKNYVAIHVTPQPEGSYASFETNIIDPGYREKVKKIVSIFGPGKLSLVLRTGSDDACLGLYPEVDVDLKGYFLTERLLHRLDCGYVVTFLNYKVR